VKAGARGALPFAVLIAVWWLVTRLGFVQPIFLPPPGDVIRVATELASDGSLWIDIAASLGRVFLGIVAGVPLAVGLGVLVALNRRLAPVVEPIVGFFNALSGIAWLPLAITWFGLGWTSVTFIMFNTIFFLVFFNTLVGVRAVPRIFEQAVLTMGGSRRHVIFQVLIPGALPSVVTGLGFLIYNGANFLQSDTILVGIIVIGVLWLLTDRLLLRPLERRTIERWGLVSIT